MCGRRRLPEQPEPVGSGWGRDKRPVINVSWDDAKEYVAWLSSARRERATGCSPRPSGSTRRGRERGRAIRSAMSSRTRRPTTTRADGSGRPVSGQRLRPPRHARQRVGMGRGLLRRQLQTARPTTARPEQPEIAVAVSFAAVPGTTIRGNLRSAFRNWGSTDIRDNTSVSGSEDVEQAPVQPSHPLKPPQPHFAWRSDTAGP